MWSFVVLLFCALIPGVSTKNETQVMDEMIIISIILQMHKFSLDFGGVSPANKGEISTYAQESFADNQTDTHINLFGQRWKRKVCKVQGWNLNNSIFQPRRLHPKKPQID